ncbi:MAG: hypothetical protein KC502_03035 [Myxococcales bacterium]|nr:hypothetical protein [Myxococcales bacterium]
MEGRPNIQPLIIALRSGLPVEFAAEIADSTGLDFRSVRRLVDLWTTVAEVAKTPDLSGETVGIVAPGNLFIATWQLVMEALACGAHARVRASRRDARSVAVLQRLLQRHVPPLAARIEVRHFSPDSPADWRAFGQGLCALVAQGSDGALAGLQRQIGAHHPDLPLRLHGHRLSFAWAAGVPSSDGWQALAHDVLLADGRGCMAPRALLVAGPIGHVDEVGATCDAALRKAAEAFPRGQLPPDLPAVHRAWVEEQRFAAAMDGRPFAAAVREDYAWVVVGGACSGPISPADLGPGGRLLVVRAASEQLSQWQLTAPHTSTVALWPWPSPEQAERLQAIGVRRCCALGQMQAPPWTLTSDGGPLGEFSLPT